MEFKGLYGSSMYSSVIFSVCYTDFAVQFH